MSSRFQLLELLRAEASVPAGRFWFAAGTAGLSNAAVLALINSSAEQAAKHEHGFFNLVLLGLVAGLYVVSQKFIMTTSIREVESVLHRIRTRIAEKIRSSGLLAIETIGHSSIFSSINSETETISQASSNIIVGLQAGVLIVFTLLYIASLSLLAFAIACGFIAFGLSVYFGSVAVMKSELRAAALSEERLFELVAHLLDGFKEVRLNRRRSDEVKEALTAASDRTRQLKTNTEVRFAKQFVFTRFAFYMLVAVIVFLVPGYKEGYSDVVVKVSTAILFIMGPISTLVGSIQTFASANVAAERILGLEARLDAASEPDERAREYREFRTLALSGVEFAFDTNPARSGGFKLGPLDLEIHAGEIVFITGGNGTGKSTLLKVLTALYAPSRGYLAVDGRRAHADVRGLFSCVFADYHLFDRLYGCHPIDYSYAEAWLAILELRDVTQLGADGSFSTTSLSTGQRKRLALLACLLERRPICVLDEWAADQDPVFRGKFYRELLPRLKAEGRTIIAVTHDDKYFDAADRVIKLDEGRLAAVS